MKTKILSIVLVFTIVFAMVSIFWLDYGGRKADIFKVENAIESISVNSEDFRNDLELTTAILELIEFCYQDLGAKYSFRSVSSTELSNADPYYSIVVTSEGLESTRVLRIETSFGIDDVDEFKDFAKKLIFFYTTTFSQFKLMYEIQDFLTPDGESFFIILELLKYIYNAVQATVVGVRIIISSIPLIITILVDSIAIVKDFVILPFRLFI